MGLRSLARKIHDEPTVSSAITLTHGATGTAALAFPCVVYGIYTSLALTATKFIRLYDQTSTTAVAGNLKLKVDNTLQMDHAFPMGVVFNKGLMLTNDDASIDPVIYILYSRI